MWFEDPEPSCPGRYLHFSQVTQLVVMRGPSCVEGETSAAGVASQRDLAQPGRVGMNSGQCEDPGRKHRSWHVGPPSAAGLLNPCLPLDISEGSL